MTPNLRHQIVELKQSLESVARKHRILRELLVLSTEGDSRIVINGLQQIKAIYSVQKFPLEMYEDVFHDLISACNIALDGSALQIGRKIAQSSSSSVSTIEDRYVVHSGKATVVFRGSGDFVSANVQDMPELDEFLTEMIVALNNGLRRSLVEVSKKMAEIA